MPPADAASELSPDEIVGRSFSTHFRGYDTGEVRAFLRSVGDAHRSLLARVQAAEAIESRAAELVSAAEIRAAEVLREAQDEARRIVEAVAGDRERGFAEGAARAEVVLADAESTRQQVEADARSEGERLVAEAKAARHRVLDDLRRRRTSARAQVEQLNAARERLMAALQEVRSAIDATTTGLRDVMPEVKAASDAAARRVAAEDETTIDQLEAEIDALKLAGLSLLPIDTPADADAEADEPVTGDDEEGEGIVGSEGSTAGDGGADADADDGIPSFVGSVSDRRSSSVRIVRPMRSQDPATGLPEEELVPIEPPDPDETVRLIGLDEDAETDAGTDAGVAEQAAGDDDEPEAEVGSEPEPEPAQDAPEGDEESGESRPSQAAVDALFARLKAGREERVADAEAVLAPAADEPTAPVEPEPQPIDEAAETETQTEAEADVEEAADDPTAVLLARRDTTLAPATAALNRRLKRLLADEQNELLDRLRRAGTATAVPPAEEHDGVWTEAASDDLALAAAAGSGFYGGGASASAPPDDLVGVAEALADAVARPLRERLEQVVTDAEGDADVAGAAVRATYRTWRSERVGPAIDHAVLDAFALGVSAAFGAGRPVTWIADDVGVTCSDCQDNALAGELPCGEAFPTGHRRPPVHQGCRCLLAEPVAAEA